METLHKFMACVRDVRRPQDRRNNPFAASTSLFLRLRKAQPSTSEEQILVLVAKREKIFVILVLLVLIYGKELAFEALIFQVTLGKVLQSLICMILRRR